MAEVKTSDWMFLLEWYELLPKLPYGAKYMLYGFKVNTHGVPYLEGYVHFKQPIYEPAGLIPRAKWAPCDESRSASIARCTFNADEVEEFGYLDTMN